MVIGDWYNSHRGHREFNNNLATDFTDCADFVLAAEEKQIEFNIGNLCVLSELGGKKRL